MSKKQPKVSQVPRGIVPLGQVNPCGPKRDQFWAVIETPQGSRNKFAYDSAHGFFVLSKVLPLGAVFPFDFGFFPLTLAEDGDPLDVLVLMDAPAFPGCLVLVRLIGVIEGKQHEKNGKCRNDRLIAVAVDSDNQRNVDSLDDLDASIVEELEHFFTSYRALGNKPFQPLGRHGRKRAKSILTDAMRRFERHGSG